jgi:hypothetical protein
MKIHLVTYATPRFYVRQAFLGLSARANGVADTVTAWNPGLLSRSGIAQDMASIDLTARGSGYWAWKPYIIERKLREVPDGDVVLYCDVGRRYPFKTLASPINPYLAWMREKGQAVMPGIRIPWKGPMSMWTKRAALHAANLDTPEVHGSTPIQASFSIWIAGDAAQALCDKWLELCSRPILINDEPSPPPLDEHPDFFEHRHDQSLLSLCCISLGYQGLDVGKDMPSVDTQHPDEILHILGEPAHPASLSGGILKAAASACATAERILRRKLRFGDESPEPDVSGRQA